MWLFILKKKEENSNRLNWRLINHGIPRGTQSLIRRRQARRGENDSQETRKKETWGVKVGTSTWKRLQKKNQVPLEGSV